MEMKQRLLIILAFCIISLNISAQMLWPVVGTYKSKGAQGMAIWKDVSYVFNDGGHCRVIDLKSGALSFEFDLASSNLNPHINNACFGIESKDGSNTPVIYISETNKPYRCFVESVINGKAHLEQIIDASMDGKLYSISDWTIDREEGCLYGINRKWNQYLDEEGNVENTIIKYRLPKMEEGEHVTLTEADVMNKFVVLFAEGMQGAKIKKGKMYIVTGLCEMDNHKKDASRTIVVVDLKKGIIKKKIDLSRITTNEPEDMDFYKGTGVLFCGQNGGLYKVKL